MRKLCIPSFNQELIAKNKLHEQQKQQKKLEAKDRALTRAKLRKLQKVKKLFLCGRFILTVKDSQECDFIG